MKKVFWFILIVTIFQISVFTYYNRLIGQTNGVVPVSPALGGKIFSGTKEKNVTLFEGTANCIALSANRQMVAYVDEANTLHVKDLQANNEVLNLPGEGPISYVTWIENNGLLIGSTVDNGSGKKLTLKTVMLSSQNVRTIKEFEPDRSSYTFKKIVFSPYTNDIYILVGNKWGTQLYHVGTSGDFRSEDISSYYIDNIEMSTTKNELFFQDVKNGIPYLHIRDDQGTRRIKKNAVLLRTVNDVLYYGTLDDSGMVSAVYKYQEGTTGTSTKVTDLNTPVKPEKLLVKDDGTVITISGSSYTNLSTNQSTPLPSDGEPFILNNSLLVNSPSKTTLINI
ncbi:hypothetical protein [Aneurinibacillus terranovensis]|uniref:hypothetical protein n=1 Tax=Aneurinibacillus terranovensis TaxID=278991 RepID=UPI0003FA5BBC|nr:hypothetical protein [Aneurinibacillus terranovensis]